jgi:hypothetical protein
MDDITDVETLHTCAFEQCQCQIPSTQEYCSEYCEDADDVDEADIQCECTHASCGLD